MIAHTHTHTHTHKHACTHTHTQIWDIAGQDHYRAMTRTYYKGASGCIVMFDITKRNTFTEAKTWKDDLDAKLVLSNGQNVPCLLLANKVHLLNVYKSIAGSVQPSVLSHAIQYILYL